MVRAGVHLRLRFGHTRSMAKDDRRFLKYLAAEREAGHMYRSLADLAQGDQRDALIELAQIEDRHAEHWASLLEERGIEVPPDSGSLDPDSQRLVARARQFSLGAVLPELEAAERDAQGTYDAEPEALPGMADDEHVHAEVLQGMRTGQSSAPIDGKPTKSVDEVRQLLNNSEHWHRTDKSGTLRAAVFGVSDGLVSNTALVMGFAGSGTGQGTVLFAGLAGLLAGAFSMAAGEFVSVSSQRDLFAREIAMEAQELKEKPLEEQRELELLYRAKGLDANTARTVAERIMSDPKTALDTLAREELGLDPDELGSPVKVAGSSFLAFAVGAVVPVIPYVFAGGMLALWIAIGLAVIALIAVGSAVGYLSGAGMLKSAMRQLAVGVGAAAVTFIVGTIVGVSLG